VGEGRAALYQNSLSKYRGFRLADEGTSFRDTATSILTNDLYGDHSIRRRQTEAPEQLR
jgi:hypothetical protein